jgi:hypothetical protein
MTLDTTPKPFNRPGLDPAFVAFAQWLLPLVADSVSGPLATHFAANGFLPYSEGTNVGEVGCLVGPDGTFRPIMTAYNNDEDLSTSPPIAWLSASAAAADQALRIRSFNDLQLSIRFYGPPCSAAEYSAAIAAYNA